MGVRYKFETSDFKHLASKEDKSSLSGKTNTLTGLGKSEYEEIAQEFINKAVASGKWPELELKNVINAEQMADSGYLFRCKPAIKDPCWSSISYIVYGTYQITNEALENILEGNKTNNL